MKKTLFLAVMLFLNSKVSANIDPFSDASRAYNLPTFTKNNQGEAVLYWTEKDDKNVIYLYFSTSKDGGKTFSDKKLIEANAGLGNGRLMRPKLLFKKDGSMVAVFSVRSWAASPPQTQKTAPTTHEGGHGNHEKPAVAPAPKPKRDSQIKYTISKDNGNTWASPVSVDADTAKVVRGFFDAVILPNDEIAVVYLKDVAGSTKHEERDLRLVSTKNGVFQAERVIDPVVCDCCNISMLVDSKGTLNVFYRDNNDDIRDIARMTSIDNGVSFSKPQILHNDKWEIKGCPHSGPTSVATANGSLITWFSGANENSGVRLVNSEGEILKLLSATAKNAHVSADNKDAAFVWEQTAENGTSSVFYSKLKKEELLDNQSVSDSEFGQNVSSALVNGKILVAYEVAKPNQKTTLRVQIIE